MIITILLTVHITVAICAFITARTKAIFDRGMHYTPNSLLEDMLLCSIWEVPLGLALIGSIKHKLRKS